MKNGNATLCGWLRLCILLLAIFPSLARAGNSFTFTANANGATYSGAGYIGVDGRLYSTLQNYSVISADETLNFGVATESIGNGVDVGINAPGAYVLKVGWGNLSGGSWYTLNLTWDGTRAVIQTPATNQVALTVMNYLNRTQSISCSGAPSQGLGPLTTSTLIFAVTGNVGAPITLGSTPRLSD